MYDPGPVGGSHTHANAYSPTHDNTEDDMTWGYGESVPVSPQPLPHLVTQAAAGPSNSAAGPASASAHDAPVSSRTRAKTKAQPPQA